MTRNTHMADAVLTATFVCHTLPGDYSSSGAKLGWLITASLCGACLPDLDTRYSMISCGRIGNPISLILKKIFKVTHRGAMHTPFFWCIFLAIGIFISKSVMNIRGVLPGHYHYIMFFGLFLGALSHVILDSFTPQGTMLLYPISKRYFSPLARKLNMDDEENEDLLRYGIIALCFWGLAFPQYGWEQLGAFVQRIFPAGISFFFVPLH